MVTLPISPCLIADLSEGNGRLFPEVPVVDQVIMTPVWPTSAAGPESFCFDNTGPSEVACDGRWLYVADSNNHRILIYDEETLTLIKVLGQKDAYSRIPRDEDRLDHPVAVDSDGKLLFVADIRAHRIPPKLIIYNLSTFKQIVVDVPFEVTDLAWDGKWLYTAAGSKVIIYTNITRLIEGGLTTPEDIKEYTIQLGGDEAGCSRTLMGKVTSIDVDDRYLYVMDSKNNRVLIWEKNNLENGAPADYVLGYYDFNGEKRVEDPAGKLEGPYDLAANGRYIFVHASTHLDGRILVFERDKLENGMLASYVIGRESFDDLTLSQAPTWKKLSAPRGLAADEKFLFVADKNFYAPSIFRFNLSNLRSGLKADSILGVFWHRNPKYDLEIVNGKMFVAGQEYVGVFNHVPTENYAFPDFYLHVGAVGVSSDGQHLCVISKGGPIAIYNGIPAEKASPDIIIDIPGVTGGGAASGIACDDGKLAATNSFWEQSKVLVWKSMPTRDNQPPDVILTEFNGERIMEPFNVYIYKNILFVALHTGSKVLIYRNIDALTDESDPDLILGENEGLRGGIHDIFYDGENLFISTGTGIHIYHGLPKEPREPDETISEVDIGGVRFMLDPWGIYYDGEHLWIFQGCSRHYSYIIRISRKRTEPVHPEMLIRDDFKIYAEKGSEILGEVMNLFERMESEEDPQTIKEDFRQLMEEKVPSFLWFPLEMIYALPVKEHVEKPEKPQAVVPGTSDELTETYRVLLKKYESLNETYTMLIENYTKLKTEYQSLIKTCNETLENLNLEIQELRGELKTKRGELILYRNLTAIFIITTIILAATVVYLAKQRG